VSNADIALARRLAPVIRFCDNEPFLPSRVGISVLAAPSRSPSSSIDIAFEPGIVKVIEYAIWWDWDIQHLYELEHIWLKLDSDDAIVSVEASAHGGKLVMKNAEGDLPYEDGRITLISAPGKHAFTASVDLQAEGATLTTLYCQELAGRDRILIPERFSERLTAITSEDHRAVKRYLQSRGFLPTSTFGKRFDLAEVEFVSWSELESWIPERITQVLQQVRNEQPLLKAVFLDSGDTMIDEATEKFDADGYVLEAALIPGAVEMVRSLAEEGYRLALVADGRVRSFATVLGHYGLGEYFDVQVISETVGCEKPDPRMFETAMQGLALTADDAGAVAMVGNNLERDIGGANALGIVSIWQSWSKRRTHVPSSPNEVPLYAIRSPGELPRLLADIELHMARERSVPRVQENHSE
jgi:putative hydrolase of the HAD superfamily